jgi:hypothetical protein
MGNSNKTNENYGGKIDEKGTQNNKSKDSVDTDSEWLSLHEEMISNSDMQKIETLNGEHYLHWTNADKIAEMTKEFISTHLK